MTSRTTRSGGRSRAATSAPGPSAATSTVCPSYANARWSDAARRASSSTTRMRMRALTSRLPAVIRGVARLHRNEQAGRRRADLAAGMQLRFDRGAVAGDLDRVRDDLDVAVRGCRSLELDAVFRRHRTRRSVGAGLLHKVVR